MRTMIMALSANSLTNPAAVAQPTAAHAPPRAS